MNENISDTFKIILERYGAKIEKNLNKKCNLVVWKGYIIIKDGNEKNINKALSYKIPVVNIIWIEDTIVKKEKQPY